MIVSSPEGSVTPAGSWVASHSAQKVASIIKPNAQKDRVSLALSVEPLPGIPPKMSVRIVWSPVPDNGGVDIPIALKLQPLSSNPESHAQVLSDRRHCLKVAFKEPAVAGVHCVKCLADFTQSGG
jgi:hypothetical protein